MPSIEQLRNEVIQARIAISRKLGAAEQRLAEAPPHALGRQMSVWIATAGRAMAGLVSPAAAGLTFKEALATIGAASEVLVRLAQASADTAQLERYAAAQQALVNEAAALVNLDWSMRDEQYRALTADLKSASGTLKEARARAQAAAKALNITADLLSAFSKLVGALA